MKRIARTSGFRILICDRDPRFARQVGRLAAEREHSTLFEPSLGRAVGLVETWKPDFILLSSEYHEDPRLDAFERAVRKRCPRPAIILTGTMERFDLAKAVWGKGADEFVFRPLLSEMDIEEAASAAMKTLEAEPDCEPSGKGD